MATADIVLAIISAIVFVWDFLTWPIYQAIYQPWEKRKALKNPKRARTVRSTDDELVFETPEKTSELYFEIVKSQVETMADALKWSVAKHGNKPIMGTREIIAELDEVQPNGRMFKKYDLGDYRWITYEDLESTADYFGRGLRSLGLNPREKICIFADTRSEWMIAAQGCFKQCFPLCTLYTNLGEEAVVHGLNQTQATHVITSHELLPKFKNILTQAPTVTTIVYFEHQINSTNTTGFPDNVSIIPFFDVVRTGQKLSKDVSTDPLAHTPNKNDTAIIMYTSGSTGVPKGVVLTHKNLFSTMISISRTMDICGPPFSAGPSDTYLAFLPVAHVLELLCESIMLTTGIKIGYSTPHTLTDTGTMVKRGCKGDATILRPTVMAAVPLMLDRIYKAINEKVKKGSPFAQKLFTWAYDYRLEAMRNGEETPIMNTLIFRKIRMLLGGKMRLMLAGGAPLSKEVHDFMRVCMGNTLLQGYGLTEVCACATLMAMDDLGTELVGTPNQGVQLKLINWEEGNYRVTDKPNPRGEIIIGGNCVADGYFLLEEKTKEDFYMEDGRRWFKSGDIGSLAPNGNLKIIDRRKDLVKLQFGEYVSLGKVEAALKTCPIVENVCIYGESSKSYCVALLVPDQNQLKALAEKLDKTTLDFETQCSDKDLTYAVLRELQQHGKKYKLEKFEIPGGVTMVKEIWDPESGLVTAAFKLKRRPLQDKYQDDINRMYGQNG